MLVTTETGVIEGVSYIEIEFTYTPSSSLLVATNQRHGGSSCITLNQDSLIFIIQWCQWWRIKVMHIWDRFRL
jgi:hypothetical protein